MFLQTRTRFGLKDGWSGFVESDLPIERLTPDPGVDPGLEGMSGEERVAAAREQAGRMFPELQREFLDTLAAVEGRIHFAGEHTSPWTGWMQGALESARRVVREINR